MSNRVLFVATVALLVLVVSPTAAWPAGAGESSDGRRLDVSETWTKKGVVLDLGPAGSPDSTYARYPFVLRDDDGTYKMWYSGFDGSRNRILFAESADGVNWVKRGVTIDVSQPPFYFDSVAGQSVLRENGVYHMWFHGGFWGGGPFGIWGQIYHAVSADGFQWSIDAVALGLGPEGAWDGGMIHFPSVVRDATGRYRMYYKGWDGTTSRIGLAVSRSYTDFTRTTREPVLSEGPAESWYSGGIGDPFAVSGRPWKMYFAGHDAAGTWRIGFALSRNGNRWKESGVGPVLSGDAWPAFDSGGVYGPSYLADATAPRIYYTGFDGTHARIGLATGA